MHRATRKAVVRVRSVACRSGCDPAEPARTLFPRRRCGHLRPRLVLTLGRHSVPGCSGCSGSQLRCLWRFEAKSTATCSIRSVRALCTGRAGSGCARTAVRPMIMNSTGARARAVVGSLRVRAHTRSRCQHPRWGRQGTTNNCPPERICKRVGDTVALQYCDTSEKSKGLPSRCRPHSELECPAGTPLDAPTVKCKAGCSTCVAGTYLPALSYNVKCIDQVQCGKQQKISPDTRYVLRAQRAVHFHNVALNHIPHRLSPRWCDATMVRSPAEDAPVHRATDPLWGVGRRPHARARARPSATARELRARRTDGQPYASAGRWARTARAVGLGHDRRSAGRTCACRPLNVVRVHHRSRPRARRPWQDRRA